MKRVAITPLWVVALASLWMALVGNGALWRKLGELNMLDGLGGVAFGLGMLVMIWGALAALLSALAWRFTLKPVVTALLLATAGMSYFMWSYRVVIDPTMIDNLVQTDVREVGGLLGVKMFLSLVLFALPPIWLLWRQPVNYGGVRRQLLRNPLAAVAALCVMLVAAVAIFQPMASLMRNHKEVRYLINPLNGVYSLARVGLRPWERNDSVLVRVGEDARLGPGHEARARPALLLLVLGETARSANFSINGYGRPTSPEIERAQVASFRNAWSCGTSTAASVPCMFSNLTRDKFEDRKTSFEGLLDVLQRAGLAVLWVDNQSGCKGVCERVPSVSTADLKDPRFCAAGECLDEIMLQGLEERIAALDAKRRARGVVVVMHQMGSHGPAYYQRSPKPFKRFLPECTSTALQDCSRDSVVNAYDNTLVYTDHFLGQTIEWLKRQQAAADTAMVYVSDHGESLGEGNLYLHGLPYAVAPDVQKKVPWVTWLSPGYEKTTGLTMACLRERRDAEVSHDNYFHSVLGLMDVSTTAYQAGMDAYAPCRPGVR